MPIILSRRRRLLTAAILILALGPALLRADPVRTVVAYNSYLQPPFVDDRGGLAQVLVNYLNLKLADQYRFQLENIPRARLMRTALHDPEQFADIALFLNPRFVGDADRSRFLWSPPLSHDRNLLIFRGPAAPDIRKLQDLKGMRFGHIRDYRNRSMDELVTNGLISREEAGDELANLRKVLVERIDFTVMNSTMFTVLSRQYLFGNRLVGVAVPDDPPFTRHILTSRRNPELAKRIDALVKAMPGDPDWKKLSAAYDLEIKGLPDSIDGK